MTDKVVEQVQAWLENVVIGLNLCPFAQKPHRQGQIHYSVFEGTDDKQLLATLLEELEQLSGTSVEKRETTLLITPDALSDFADYNQFLEDVDWMIERAGFSGTYQVASFHPNYQFAGTLAEDTENLTNRAPYPIFHLLREDSLALAIEKYPDTQEIPHNNIVRMEALTDTEKKSLFPFLYGK